MAVLFPLRGAGNYEILEEVTTRGISRGCIALGKLQENVPGCIAIRASEQMAFSLHESSPRHHKLAALKWRKRPNIVKNIKCVFFIIYF